MSEADEPRPSVPSGGDPPPVDVAETAAEPIDVGDAADDEDGEEWATAPVPRWVSMTNALGVALVTVVAVQLVASIVEGLILKEGEGGLPQGLRTRALHRLAVSFVTPENRGTMLLLFLIVAVVLIALPAFARRDVDAPPRSGSGLALTVALVSAVVIALSYVLYVWAQLDLFRAADQAVPNYLRVRFINLLLGTLGTAAIAVFACIAALNLLDRPFDPEPDGVE